MAKMDQTTSLPGASAKYQIHPEAKRYTMRDNGFTESKSGNFQLVRSLGESASDKAAPRMKITVSKDFDGLKMSTTTANGLQSMNLYNHPKHAAAVENAEAVLYGLEEGNVLKKVK